MFVSGTPCPILNNGQLIVGKRAFLVMKMEPETYIPDYGTVKKKLTSNQIWYNNLLNIGKTINENSIDTDDESVSDKFRSSSK